MVYPPRHFHSIAFRFQDCYTMKAKGNRAMSNVRQLYPDRPLLGHFVRIGATGYQQVEELLEKGRITIDRAVFDAGLMDRQQGVFEVLARAGSELILDPNVAELSSIRYFDGALKAAPWSIAGRPLSLEDFRGVPGLERIGRIAEFAVQHRFHAVLAPTHLLMTGSRDAAFRLDMELAEKLRAALDAAGGQNIAIDYPLILNAGVLKDPKFSEAFARASHNLPIENLWVRSSGFGSTVTPTAIVKYVRCLRELLPASRPIIADGSAGFAGLAALALGAAAGLGHGIGVHESFKASEWHNKRPASGGGQPKRILINALDRQLKTDQMQAILNATNGRRMISCSEPHCCPSGLKDMQDYPKAHYLYQRRRPIEDLSRVPYARRGDHFVTRIVGLAVDEARNLDRLRITDANVKKVISESRDRVERIYELLGYFHENNDVSEHVPSLRDRRAGPTTRAKGLQ